MHSTGVEPVTLGSEDQTAIAISLRKSHLRFPHFTQIATNYMGMVRVWYRNETSFAPPSQLHKDSDFADESWTKLTINVSFHLVLRGI